MSSFESSKTIQRILGGEDALSPIPWQVQVYAGFIGVTQTCSGTILDETTILTAANCVYVDGDLESELNLGIAIIAGIITTDGPDGSLNGQKISVMEVRVCTILEILEILKGESISIKFWLKIFGKLVSDPL